MYHNVSSLLTLGERIETMLVAYERWGLNDGAYGTVRHDDRGTITVQADGLDGLLELRADGQGWHARLDRDESVAADRRLAIHRALRARGVRP